MLKFPSILPVLALALSAAFFTPVTAQEPVDQTEEGNQRKKPKAERRSRLGLQNTARFFKRFDANKDDKFSRKEFYSVKRIGKLTEDERARIFDRLDKDQDNFITRAEFKALAKKARPNPLAEADTNKDGNITFEEFSKFPRFAKMAEKRRKKIFTQLDRDKNEVINKRDGVSEGGRDGKPMKWRPRFWLKKWDLDNSGTLSFGEFQNLPPLLTLSGKEKRRHFKFFDTNGDGEITQAEKNQANQKMGPPLKSRTKPGKKEPRSD